MNPHLAVAGVEPIPARPQLIDRFRFRLGFYCQTVDWLAHHHANLGRDSTHDLDADERWNAVWKLSGQSIAHTYALLEFLQAGYTGQTWALMRSIHEVDRLLVAVCNPDEERIPAGGWPIRRSRKPKPGHQTYISA